MPQLDRLGLKENPFNNNTSQQFFYADQSRAQIMESTEHLIDFSNNLQVIIGAQGVGKSHFLEALKTRKGNNWQVVKIQDVAKYDTLSLIQTIMNDFGAHPDGEVELLEVLENQLSEIIQLGSKPLLLIDNAQNLSTDSIRFLLQLSQQELNDEPYIHIVLFSTSIITDVLQSPEFKDYRDSVHIAILDNFDKEGVSGYLRHKLAVAGFNRESPFTPRIIDSIYNDSTGNPEKINFFAEKFLASSGKGENYISPAQFGIENNEYPNSDSDNQLDIQNTISDDDSIKDKSIASNETANEISSKENMNIFSDSNIDENNTDHIDEQLSRLTEQFDEIEKMAEQSNPGQSNSEQTSFFNQELIDEDDFSDIKDKPDSSLENNHEQDTKYQAASRDRGLNFAKVIIPIATIVTILTAVFAINSIFNSSETQESVDTIEHVDLLPLELPPEGSFEIEEAVVETEKAKTEADNTDTKTDPAALETLPKAEDFEIVELAETVDIVETAVSVEINNDTNEVAEIITQAQEIEVLEATEVIKIIKPEINTIEPSPIIGSTKRQSIIIKGQNFTEDMQLVLFFDNKDKVFSKQATPGQWQFVNNNSIKLHLTTGANEQQWSILAQTEDSVQSNRVNFKIVKPYSKIKTTIIDRLSPNPMPGSDKRQALTILGQGFSADSVFELTWDNNKKQFSRHQTPSQFQYHSANKIQLFIATGKEKRKWGISLIDTKGTPQQSKSFNVTLDAIAKNQTSKTVTSSSINGEKWLLQQVDKQFTLQLFSSNDKNAIPSLVKKYSLSGNIAVFSTQRDNRTWYSMTYGKYNSKQEANTAISALDPKLSNPKPWIRDFSSIKKQIQEKNSQAANIPNKNIIAKNTHRDDAWIWTQNPADYTIQLISLSTKQAVIDFARNNKIENNSTQFTIKSSGKILHVLVYGVYSNKESAVKVKNQLAAKIKSVKPWVRSFSDIHELMSKQ